jgi:hypothetical protein
LAIYYSTRQCSCSLLLLSPVDLLTRYLGVSCVP